MLIHDKIGFLGNLPTSYARHARRIGQARKMANRIYSFNTFIVTKEEM